MAETPSPLPRHTDPWRVATPLQLITLLERLGVSGSEIGRWLHVSRSSISMWRHGTREVPPKHLRTLRQQARLTLDQQAELTDKAANLAPTADLGQALRAEFAALWQRWMSEVLYDAGTLRRNMQVNVATLGQVLDHDPFTAEDQETLEIITDTLVQQGRLRRQLQGATPDPDPEAALHARLTAAHEAVSGEDQLAMQRELELQDDAQV